MYKKRSPQPAHNFKLQLQLSSLRLLPHYVYFLALATSIYGKSWAFSIPALLFMFEHRARFSSHCLRKLWSPLPLRQKKRTSRPFRSNRGLGTPGATQSDSQAVVSLFWGKHSVSDIQNRLKWCYYWYVMESIFCNYTLVSLYIIERLFVFNFQLVCII